MIPPFADILGAATPLQELARATRATLLGDPNRMAVGIRQDSRDIRPDEVFLARKGQHSDGLAHVHQAISRGACAIMAERGHAPTTAAVPVVLVDDAKLALAEAASLIYGRPSDALDIVAITGTNGKTTTASVLCGAIRAAGLRPAMLGTFGARFGGCSWQLRHNTPEADELARLLAWLRDQRASHVVLEATSHALAQRRLDGVRVKVGAFTNLTHDHLDLHGDMEAYGRAKARLLIDLSPASSVVMVDDPFGAQLARRVTGPLMRVSRIAADDADVCPVGPTEFERGIRCRVRTPVGEVELRSALFGLHNLANLLLALAIGIAMGCDAAVVTEAVGHAGAPEGRLQRCGGPGDDIAVFVDYAHTPDGLDKALRAVRAWTGARVICVFGCGGNRDRTKRAAMGRIASELADVVIVTSDNPRGESPGEIAREVVSGVRPGCDVRVDIDRAIAIQRAIELAAPGDVVLVAGKGHEKTQELNGERHPFDDVVEVNRCLAERRPMRDVSR